MPANVSILAPGRAAEQCGFGTIRQLYARQTMTHTRNAIAMRTATRDGWLDSLYRNEAGASCRRPTIRRCCFRIRKSGSC